MLSLGSLGVLTGCADTRAPVRATDAGTTITGDGGADGGACAPSDLCIDTTDPANDVVSRVDGAGILNASGDHIMIVRLAVAGSDAFAVVSAICPHAFCDVDYDAAARQLPCYCHGSLFGLDGTLLRGPARTGLRQYAWDFDGTTLTIHT